MQPIYAQEPFPARVIPKSIFLAGPTPRSAEVASWRPEALRILQDLEFTGDVYVPEPRNGVWAEDYIEQVKWETEGLQQATVIVFWIPRDLATLPGFTTNIEWGIWASSKKVVLGYPPNAEKMTYILYMAREFKVPTFTDLKETLQHTVKLLR
jgi:hypothetical protein